MPGPFSAPRPPLRVLVVDDCRDTAESTAILLRLHGHDARSALDGPSAIALAGPFAPDVVLLDLGMHGMSGYEVAAKLAARCGPAPPVLIAVTGWAREEDMGRARAAGFHLHLAKPVEPATLLATLGQIAGGVVAGPSRWA
jgi:CheY-like chemotaxis protein